MATTTMTPAELAEKVNRDPKVVRAYLRKEFTRDPEVKNSRWEISAKTVNAVTKHFAELDEKAAKAS